MNKLMLKSIPYFPGYAATIDGRIWSYKSNKFLSLCSNGTGYKIVFLMKNNKRHPRLVSRLILKTFAGPCPDGKECRHLNGVRADNRLENLRWSTHLENEKDKEKHGTKLFGEKQNGSKLTASDVRFIIYLWRTNLFNQHEIAKMFNVDHANISAIVLKKSWKHLWTK